MGPLSVEFAGIVRATGGKATPLQRAINMQSVAVRYAILTDPALF